LHIPKFLLTFVPSFTSKAFRWWLLNRFLTMTTLEKQVLNQFTEFVQRNGIVPNYARCEVRFHNEVRYYEDVIALNSNPDGNENNPFDDEVMFYCNGLGEFLQLLAHVPDVSQLYDFEEGDKAGFYSTKEDFCILRVVEFFRWDDDVPTDPHSLDDLKAEVVRINRLRTNAGILAKKLLAHTISLFKETFGTNTIYFPKDEEPYVAYSVPDEDNIDCAVRSIEFGDGTSMYMRLYSPYKEEEYTTSADYVYNQADEDLAEAILAQIENGLFEPDEAWYDMSEPED